MKRTHRKLRVLEKRKKRIERQVFCNKSAKSDIDMNSKARTRGKKHKKTLVNN